MIPFPLITQIHNILVILPYPSPLLHPWGHTLKCPQRLPWEMGAGKVNVPQGVQYKTRENGCGELTFKHTHARLRVG